MSEQNYPSDKAERIMVRLPDGMRDRLAVVAKENKRSVNAEVVARIEESFARPQIPASPEGFFDVAAETLAMLLPLRDELEKKLKKQGKRVPWISDRSGNT